VYRSRRTVTTASAEVIGRSVDFGGATLPTTAEKLSAMIAIKWERQKDTAITTFRRTNMPHALIPGRVAVCEIE